MLRSEGFCFENAVDKVEEFKIIRYRFVYFLFHVCHFSLNFKYKIYLNFKY